MKDRLNSAIATSNQPSECWGAPEAVGPRRLEVNVIFTDPRATVVALKTARELASDLGASIRVRAAIVVPYALSLDTPPVSTDFVEKLLSDLVVGMDLEAFEPSIDLYLCRNRIESLLNVLSPNSLVVLGGQKHWWPTAERRLAKALRSKGHRVLFIGLKTQTKSDSR